MKKVIVALVLMLCSCARAPLKNPQESMRRVERPPLLADDLPLDSLRDAVALQLAQFDAAMPPRPGTPSVLHFGERDIARADYINGLRRFLAITRAHASGPSDFFKAVSEEFDFYEVYGRNDWGSVFVTSYFEPVIQGSRQSSARFPQPLYAVPNDLVSVDLGAFDPLYSRHNARGRLADHRVTPYYTRADIDSKGALKGQGLELCYVDPWDAFSLQIQGSGIVETEEGARLFLNFAERNGYPYEPIGKFLKPLLLNTRITMGVIESYLRALPPERMQKFLNQDPSYVFFRAGAESAVTYVGLPATAGRTIATDPQFFPKGTLAFLVMKDPVAVTRFVLDQDTGGAIKGGGRVDLFWGFGPEAGKTAGALQQEGKLYYLLPKPKGSGLAR
jgi:membrane-bound lytic murein transglycosylase A